MTIDNEPTDIPESETDSLPETDPAAAEGVTHDTDEAAEDEAGSPETEETADATANTDEAESCGDACGCAETDDTSTATDEPTAAPDFPPASLEMLFMTHHTQAIMALGLVPDPVSGETSNNKSAAKFHIDMLGLIEEKTKGNLDEKESETLSAILHQLRMAFMNA